MQHKYDVTYVNAVDFMDGLTDSLDYRRACGIEEEELGFVAHLDPNDPRYIPSAGSPDDLMNISDHAHGMLLSELLDIGVDRGFVEKSGAWYSYDSDRIGQGRENAKEFMRSNPDIAEKLDHQIREALGLVGDLPPEEPEVTHA